MHKAVLLTEAVNGLNIRPDGIYLDGTFGCGGHSRLILSKLNKYGRLIAIDRDPIAIKISRLINDQRFSIIHGSFSSMANYIAKRGLSGQINGILLDLGISFAQLNDVQRGFSFKHDGPLDMRMDNTCGRTAAQWLKYATIDEIAYILKSYGEEKFAKQIARSIVKQNYCKPITSTYELANLITNVVPFNKYKHPAKRSFQAIRIFINNELEEIKKALNGTLSVLSKGGRLSIISFHSLEDRLVKRFIRNYSQRPLIPIGIPITEVEIAHKYNNCNQLKFIDRIKVSQQEINDNPHSRSSILRIAEKQ